MVDNNYQQDFFGSDHRQKKGKRPGLLNGYSKQRFLPYMKIPIEYTVMIAIGVLVLMIIIYLQLLGVYLRGLSLRPLIHLIRQKYHKALCRLCMNFNQ